MAKLTEDYRARARSEGITACPLCQRKLDKDENKRGVVEFFDGWFWVCSICKAKLNKALDYTLHDDYGEGDVVPYFRRSRRYVVKWLYKEYRIKIT